MKKQVRIPLFVSVLTLALLTACGGNPSTPRTGSPEDTTKVREVSDSNSAAIEADLALCKAAVEEVQRHDYIAIQEDNQFRGEDILNDTNSVMFMKSGEDLYRNVSIPQDAFLDDIPVFSRDQRILYKDGAYFNDFFNGYTTIENGTEQTHWGASTMSEQENALSCPLPWLLRFDWDAQEIQYISTLEIGEQTAVRIQIMGAYLPDTICESYTAEFFFNQDDHLDQVELVASFARPSRTGTNNEVGPTTAVTNVQKVLFTDQEHITKEIESLYESALEDVKNKPTEDTEDVAILMS